MPESARSLTSSARTSGPRGRLSDRKHYLSNIKYLRPGFTERESDQRISRVTRAGSSRGRRLKRGHPYRLKHVDRAILKTPGTGQTLKQHSLKSTHRVAPDQPELCKQRPQDVVCRVPACPEQLGGCDLCDRFVLVSAPCPVSSDTILREMAVLETFFFNRQ